MTKSKCNITIKENKNCKKETMFKISKIIVVRPSSRLVFISKVQMCNKISLIYQVLKFTMLYKMSKRQITYSIRILRNKPNILYLFINFKML